MQNGSPLCWLPSSHILSAVSRCLNIDIIAVPIIKKGNKSIPANFHLINLLNVLINQVPNIHVGNSVIGQKKNKFWLTKTEQATIEYCSIVNHPTEKYYSCSCSCSCCYLYRFENLISRGRLWQKLLKTSIDFCLTSLIMMLYKIFTCGMYSKQSCFRPNSHCKRN